MRRKRLSIGIIGVVIFAVYGISWAQSIRFYMVSGRLTFPRPGQGRHAGQQFADFVIRASEGITVKDFQDNYWFRFEPRIPSKHQRRVEFGLYSLRKTLTGQESSEKRGTIFVDEGRTQEFSVSDLKDKSFFMQVSKIIDQPPPESNSSDLPCCAKCGSALVCSSFVRMECGSCKRTKAAFSYQVRRR